MANETREEYIEGCLNDAGMNAADADQFILEAIHFRNNELFDAAQISIALAEVHLRRAQVHQKNAELQLYSKINEA